MGFDSKHELAPPTVLLGLLLCPWISGISSQPLQRHAAAAPEPTVLLGLLCPWTWGISSKSRPHHAWTRQWHPMSVLLPGKSHGQRSLVGCSPWGLQESDTTERLHFHFSLFTFIHWRRKWQPTPVFLPGESHGQRSLVAYSAWCHKDSDTTEVT